MHAEGGKREKVGSRRAKWHSSQEMRYSELAEGFKRLRAKFEEATLRGPFNDLLPAGQTVKTLLPSRASSSASDESRRDGGENWPIPPGTNCIVVTDWAGDSDDCTDDRPIEVRILEGAHAGKLALIERIYLRRKP